MDTVEQYFLDHLGKTGITHLVARIATVEGLNLEIYLKGKTLQ